MTYQLEDLRSINLLNYRLIECLDEPEENLITVALIFARFDHKIVNGISNVVDAQGEVLSPSSQEPLSAEAQRNLQSFEKVVRLEFMIEFEEIEDFIVEMNL